MTTGSGIGIAAVLIQTEKLAMIGAARPTQIEWLDKIAAALQKLRPHTGNVATVDQADRTIAALRSQLRSPKTQNDQIATGWVRVITALLNAAAAMDEGADTGELIDVISLFVQSCESASR